MLQSYSFSAIPFDTMLTITDTFLSSTKKNKNLSPSCQVLVVNDKQLEKWHRNWSSRLTGWQNADYKDY